MKNRYLCVAMYKQRPQNIENGTFADYGVDTLQCTEKEHTKIIENGPIISFTSFEQHVSMSVACKTSIFANELFITWGKRWSALSGSSCWHGVVAILFLMWFCCNALGVISLPFCFGCDLPRPRGAGIASVVFRFDYVVAGRLCERIL